MFVQIENNKLMAWSVEPFEGYTNEFSEIDYEDYNTHPNKYIFDGEGFVMNPDYEANQTEKRQADFLNQFFAIGDYGYFRKQPKGYGSAVESLNTAFNVVTILQKLPADTLTFYKEPNFSEAEQCTEEWLVENSYKNAEMITEEFGVLGVGFSYNHLPIKLKLMLLREWQCSKLLVS